jgi:predicted RNase H-like HicB family nuclease
MIGAGLVDSNRFGVIPMKLPVVVHPAEEGGFWAEIPALPGCVSEGETFSETLANIREAAEGWLQVASDRAATGADVQLAEIEL